MLNCRLSGCTVVSFHKLNAHRTVANVIEVDFKGTNDQNHDRDSIEIPHVKIVDTFLGSPTLDKNCSLPEDA